MDLTDVKKEARKFGLIISAAILLFGLLPLRKGDAPNLYLIVACAIVTIFAVAWPRALVPLYKLWTKFGKTLGKINAFIILTIVYYVIITPLGLIKKCFSNGISKYSFKSEKDSYWLRKETANLKNELERQF